MTGHKQMHWLATGVVLLLLCACGRIHNRPGSSGEIRIVDCAGRTVFLPEPAKRIVLIRGRDLFNLSLLLGQDVTNRVIAIGDDIRTTDRDIYEQLLTVFPTLETLPRVGSVYKNGVRIEQLIELEPDLIIMDTFMIDRRYAIVDEVRRAGLPALFTDLSGDPFSGPQKSLTVLGQALGLTERARSISEFIDRQIDPVLARLAQLPDTARPSVYIESGLNGASVYGPTYGSNCSAWGKMIDTARGKNMAESRVSGMAPIRPETLLAEDPDLILITGAHWDGVPDAMQMGGKTDAGTAAARLRGYTQRAGWRSLRAVREDRVYGLYHGFCIHATAFTALQQCAKWFYPESFYDLDPDANLRQFYEQFSPVPYEGTYFSAVTE